MNILIITETYGVGEVLAASILREINPNNTFTIDTTPKSNVHDIVLDFANSNCVSTDTTRVLKPIRANGDLQPLCSRVWDEYGDQWILVQDPNKTTEGIRETKRRMSEVLFDRLRYSRSDVFTLDDLIETFHRDTDNLDAGFWQACKDMDRLLRRIFAKVEV